MIYKLDINDRAALAIKNKTKRIEIRANEGNVGSPCGACRKYLMQLSKKSKNIEILIDRKNKNIVNLEELIPDWWGGMTEYNEKYNFTKT